MSEVLHDVVVTVLVFLGGVAATVMVMLRRQRNEAVEKAAIAETTAREAKADLETEKEVAHVKTLSDDEADRKARDLGLFSDRTPLRK